MVSVRMISVGSVSVLTTRRDQARPGEGGCPIEGGSGVDKNGAPAPDFFLHAKPVIMRPMFRDLPITARELKATPAVLERIYDGARLGLKGDSLALAAGLLPEEFARLKLMDRTAEIAEMKGRADSELEMSRVVFDAAQAGDSKAALEFLKHRHDWVATQKVEVQGSAQISIAVALEEAQKRVERITAEDVVDIAPRVLPLAREPLGDAV